MNTVHLIGRLGQSPELHTADNGGKSVRLRVAESRYNKSKNQEITQWHTVMAFGSLAEVICQYLEKGSQVYFRAEIEYREVEKDGGKVTFTNLIARDMKMLGSKSSNNAGPSNDEPDF